MILNSGVGEDAWESIKPVNLKRNKSWILVGKTDVEAKAPILWPPDVKNWLIRKDPDSGQDWRQEEKGMTEDKLIGWHHGLNGHEFEQAPGVGDGQGILACCGPRGHMTEQLNWTKLWKWEKSCWKISQSIPQYVMWSMERFSRILEVVVFFNF